MQQSGAQREVRILAVDDNQEALFNLEALLSHHGYQVSCANNGVEALQIARQQLPDLILSDVVMPEMGGYELATQIKSDSRLKYTPVLLITSKGELEDVIKGLESGADDYILKPYQSQELIARINAVLRTRKLYLELQKAHLANDLLQRSAEQRFQFDQIVGHSAALQEVFHLVQKVKDADVPVLITGESGTGKELIASALHYNSPRKQRPFLAQNCSALSENLLESELFGHVRGAFTGAHRDKQGLFKAADTGTFFLDELGEMHLSLQAKLLRVLQDGTFTPVGATRSESVDVRIVAATNRNLEQMIEEGSFREDLYYRLNVICVRLPALRERAEDIPLLLGHFLKKKSEAMAQPPKSVSDSALQVLLRHRWPGNIRELENEVERMILLSGERQVIDTIDISPRILNAQEHVSVQVQEHSEVGSIKDAVNRLERSMIAQAMRKTKGNKSEAARLLGISRSNFLSKLKDI